MQRRSGPRSLPSAPARWEEVFWWLDEITKRWGYWMHISVHPPFGESPSYRFQVTIEGRKMKWNDPTKDSTVSKWRRVKDKTVTVEQVALLMAVELHRELDSDELERERNAVAAGAMF